VSPREDTHLDDEVLALLALGERPGTPDEVAEAERHLASCARCSSEVDELGAVVRTARTVTPDDALVDAPPHVWENVVRELGGTAEQASAPAPADVVDLSEKRRSRGRLLPILAAACVGAVVGGIGVAVVTSSSSSDAGTQQQVLASTVLDPLNNSGAQGTVEVLQTSSGPVVSVDVSGLKKADNGFYEVWLLDKEAQKLIALGTLDAGDKGTFVMPPGVSMNDFPVVDVSLEPNDGNPAHSKNSLVRGVLNA
jgi:anti-sigma factor RsiW